MIRKLSFSPFVKKQDSNFWFFLFYHSYLNPSPAEPRYTDFENSVDPDQLASGEANWSWFTLFSINLCWGFTAQSTQWVMSSAVSLPNHTFTGQA